MPSRLKKEDYIGKKFGKLYIVDVVHIPKKYQSVQLNECYFVYKCDCGKSGKTRSNSVLKGKTKSCGCYNRESGYLNLKDLTNKKFGKLYVLRRDKSESNGASTWKCVCDCGNEVVVLSSSLLRGKTKSCGCIHKEQHIKRLKTHGMSGTKQYRTWSVIKSRCFNPNVNDYKYYGGLGVVMCDEWKNDFMTYYNYVSKLPNFDENGYTLDRYPNNRGNYEPNNVRWATRK